MSDFFAIISSSVTEYVGMPITVFEVANCDLALRLNHRSRRIARKSFRSPGLLYNLATAISANGGNIEVVLIDTQAHKAIDVFYVTTDGGKLTAEKQAAIRAAVEKAAGVAGR